MNLENVVKLDELGVKLDSLERRMGMYRVEVDAINDLYKGLTLLADHIKTLNDSYKSFKEEMNGTRERLDAIMSTEVKSVVAGEMNDIDKKYKELFSFLSGNDNRFANMLVADGNELLRDNNDNQNVPHMSDFYAAPDSVTNTGEMSPAGKLDAMLEEELKSVQTADTVSQVSQLMPDTVPSEAQISIEAALAAQMAAEKVA